MPAVFLGEQLKEIVTFQFMTSQLEVVEET